MRCLTQNWRMKAIIVVVFLVCHSRCEYSHTFQKPIHDFDVWNRNIYVATEDHLYQLSHKLEVENERDLSGSVPDKVKVLVVFGVNNTLVACVTRRTGYCEVLDLKNVSKLIYAGNESMTPENPQDSSLCFLVGFGSDAYLMTGMVTKGQGSEITLRNTMHTQDGEIFAAIAPDQEAFIKTENGKKINFVDGFQRGSEIYIFLNIESDKKIRLLRMQSKSSKSDVFNSLRSNDIWCCDDLRRWELVSSAYIGGDFPGYWAGVFTANVRGPKNTALAIFNITPSHTATKDPDFCFTACKGGTWNSWNLTEIKPVAVIFTHPSMTSVAAASFESWLFLFIGTAKGQLMKISLDKHLKPTCPRVLHQSADYEPVFSKMFLDPVDNKHIYMATGKQLRAVRVAQCDRYSNMRDCWSAQDPFCGWCVENKRCMFHSECPGSTVSCVRRRIVSYQTESVTSDKNRVNVITHLRPPERVHFACNFSHLGAEFYDKPNLTQCSFNYSIHKLPIEGLHITVTTSLAEETITDRLVIKNCPKITASSSIAQCYECIRSGCTWSSSHSCSWTYGDLNQAQSVCEGLSSALSSLEPKIYSVTPSVISFYGKNNAEMLGENLDNVTMIRIQGAVECYSEDLQVLKRNASGLSFHLPSWRQDVVTVCAVLPDGSCVGSQTLIYGPSPKCADIFPNNTWAGGGRNIAVLGKNLDLVDGVHPCRKAAGSQNFIKNGSHLEFQTPPKEELSEELIYLCVANETIECLRLTYLPNPEFISFKATPTGNNLRITIAKKVDKLNLRVQELNITAMKDGRHYRCEVVKIEIGNDTVADSVICEIKNLAKERVQSVRVEVGYFSAELEEAGPNFYYVILLVILALIALVITVLVYHIKKKKLSEQMDKYLDVLECEIRNEIRQGFVDLQTETSYLIENVGTIPFLDYKHFASRIFFPEGPSMSSYVKDIDQRSVDTRLGPSSLGFSKLIRNKLFLTSFIHTLEVQKDFTVKDKCRVASLLTLALHTDLPYLTEVMEDLLTALMDQSSNVHPKLLLRRTESIVEKLLTNWMSICLYGFLRESVGQPLYSLVSALTEKTSQGPVDYVTGKALYTLNEDWLLWLAEDFRSLKLKVSFPVDSGEESEPLELSVLDCDTVEQVKEKIVAAFKCKFGFPYFKQPKEIAIKYKKDGVSITLQEVDNTSKVIGEATLLNTLKHYKVPDGASISVTTTQTHPLLTPQVSVRDDQHYSTKYLHLIDPHVDPSQRKNSERKKLNLKEINLTKLLSTKVAVHSLVENLFRTIWGTANNKVSPAIKFFFDFLDSQVERKKITDPDVPHIWKTNSLPLRFWVNILKNPQFVFDVEKTPQLDGCLSVIAQTFMDSFSLVDQQLGKNAPTNKLLYIKDMPQYKQEVKAYYKLVREMPVITKQEFQKFLMETAKKHENEFDEPAALRDLHKYVARYFSEIQVQLEQNSISSDLQLQLQEVRKQFKDLSSCSWE